MGTVATCSCGNQKWKIVGNRIECIECRQMIPKELGIDVKAINRYFEGVKKGIDTTEGNADQVEFGQDGG